MTINGIDVSIWQGNIDWNAVKSAKDFAFIKATGGDGGLYVDGNAYKNYYGAKAAGLPVGQYHFAGAGDPVEEAHFFVAKVSPLEENDILILDWEVSHGDPVGWCKRFCDTVFESTGVRPIVYMSQSRTTAYDWTPVAKDCGLWVAKYGINNGTLAGAGDINNTGAFSVCAWQYTSVGSCPGIAGNVDLNIFYGSVDQLKKYGWHKPAETPAPATQPTPTPDPVVENKPVEETPKTETAPTTPEPPKEPQNEPTQELEPKKEEQVGSEKYDLNVEDFKKAALGSLYTFIGSIGVLLAPLSQAIAKGEKEAIMTALAVFFYSLCAAAISAVANLIKRFFSDNS